MQRALDSILNHRKFYFHHIFNHEFIGKVRVYSSNQSCRGIAHPNIYDIGTNVLLTSCRKGVT